MKKGENSFDCEDGSCFRPRRLAFQQRVLARLVRAAQKNRLFDFIHGPEFYMQVRIGAGAFKKLEAITESERDFMHRS